MPRAPLPQSTRSPSPVLNVLNVGSGPSSPDRLRATFPPAAWKETRLDIDPRTRPDIVSSIVNMRDVIGNDTFDAIWSSHNIEHLRAHEVLFALGEFVRILKDDGFALITCPDLEAVAQLIAAGQLTSAAYVSPIGPITPLDMLYGHSASIHQGNTFMEHKTGFTSESLAEVCLQAGFLEVHVGSGDCFDIWALALMRRANVEKIRRFLAATPQSFLLS